jgi:catechol 2,3-dioxygenase-like lactoylglutathione lyase family enzyme
VNARDDPAIAAGAATGPRQAFDGLVTFLYTRDLVASARFYGEVLGLPLALDQGSCRIYRVAREAFLGLCERPDAPMGPEDAGTRQVIVTLVTADVDGWFERLAAQGVAFEKAPATNPTYGIYHAFLRDPNGYLVEIQRFLDPRWRVAGSADR